MTRGRWVAALAGAAAAGTAWFYLREKRTWTPPYTIEQSEGGYEIRAYPPLAIAATVQRGTRDRALGDGFAVLADFARGKAGTLPVVATPAAKRGWEVRFVFPQGQAGTEQAGGVTCSTLPARRVAAIRFGGKADDALLAAMEAELRTWLEARDIGVAGPVEHAFYNSPMLPGALRHNEVWLEVQEQ